jgi:hypothetical protein
MTITVADLNRAMDNIKEHIDLRVKPLSEDVAEQKVVLHGTDGRKGLVGDMNTVKTTHRNIRWAAAGGFAGIIALVKSVFGS